MTLASGIRYSILCVACSLLVVSRAGAEDTKGKWQFGFGLSYYATTDYIRSNSDIALATTVAGQQQGLPPVGYVDERPDENMLNEPSVADDFKVDFNASYGLTRWLALELGASYLKSSIGDIEYYVEDRQKFIGGGVPSTQPGAATGCGPNASSQCFRYPGASGDPASVKTNTFVPVGEITEIPVQLSALFRFRPESPLDPYIGLGIGYILASLDSGSEFDARGAQVGNLDVIQASEGETTTGLSSNKSAPAPGFNPAPLQAEVNSGFEYHAVGGVDYFINERVAMYVDARYIWSDAAIDITTDGAHQVRLTTYNPGRLQSFISGSVEAPLYWEDTGFAGCTTQAGGSCVGDGLFATEDSNGNGTLDRGVGEGTGLLYFYRLGPNPDSPTGIWSASEAVAVYNCPGCAWVGPAPPPDQVEAFSTEDRNNTFFIDRFLFYGVDVCSQAGADTNPLCAPTDITQVPQYVWPGGCTTTISASANPPDRLAEGCPQPQNINDVAITAQDDENDVYLIQGGEIRLGGFSLGVGVKFTF